MLDETARGVFTIAATPFLPDGTLDPASIDRMLSPNASHAQPATGPRRTGSPGGFP